MKLSPQETIVFRLLQQSGARSCAVSYLYWNAKGITVAKAVKVPHRRQQQHVGVIVARLNKKQKKFVIKPGGASAPRTYVLRRR